jgi:hypothetical protein
MCVMEDIAMFILLGIVVGLYTAYAAISGSVYARRGIGGAMVLRDESPINFWATIVCYTLLSLALIIIF